MESTGMWRRIASRIFNHEYSPWTTHLNGCSGATRYTPMLGVSVLRSHSCRRSTSLYYERRTVGRPAWWGKFDSFQTFQEWKTSCLLHSLLPQEELKKEPLGLSPNSYLLSGACSWWGDEQLFYQGVSTMHACFPRFYMKWPPYNMNAHAYLLMDNDSAEQPVTSLLVDNVHLLSPAESALHLIRSATV